MYQLLRRLSLIDAEAVAEALKANTANHLQGLQPLLAAKKFNKQWVATGKAFDPPVFFAREDRTWKRVPSHCEMVWLHSKG